MSVFYQFRYRGYLEREIIMDVFLCPAKEADIRAAQCQEVILKMRHLIDIYWVCQSLL